MTAEGAGGASSENITYTFLKTGELAGNNTAGPINSSKVEVDDMRCPL